MIKDFSDERIIWVLAHELLHSIGISGHIDPGHFPDSVMRAQVPREFSSHILGAIDREAILGLYSSLEPGEWTNTSFHIRGDLSVPGGDVSFGAAFRNGLVQPWASGPTPWTNLTGNRALSGTVTWTGGFWVSRHRRKLSLAIPGF